MNECSICGKKIPKGATECSLTCMQAASYKFKGKAHSARSVFSQAMRKMLEPEPKELLDIPLEVPMIKIKHRWRKNQNIVSGSVVLRFGDDGVAEIPNVGNNKVDVDNYIKYGKGLVEYVVEEVAPPPPPKPPRRLPTPSAPAKKKDLPLKEVKAKTPIVEETSFDEDDDTPVEIPEKKQTPVKKKVDKKNPFTKKKTR